MLSLLTPAWLLGLLALPWIRWLHRGGRHRGTVTVPHLALWQPVAVREVGPGERRPPDPAWRRRALLLALLCLALAEPRWVERHTRITLWVDDSLSMLARDEKGTRIEAGLAQAAVALAALPSDHGRAAVVVRALSDPWRAFDSLESAAPALARGAGRSEPSPPPLALLQEAGAQWLLTDGADATRSDWPGGRAPDRVITVGGITRNVGIEALAARRDPDQPGRIQLLARLHNGGDTDETRTIVFANPAGEVSRSTQRLAAGSTAEVAAAMPMAASVQVTLSPRDALAEDDVAGLDLAPLRRHRVVLDSRCPRRLVGAVAAHPGLAVVTPVGPGAGEGAEAAVDCGTGGGDARLPTLRVRAEQLAQQLRGPLLWSDRVPAAQRITLGAQSLPLAARLTAEPGDTVLLAVGLAPVIVERGAGGGRRLETGLDMAAPALQDAPALPLLLNLMFERLLGEHLLEPVVALDRALNASAVAPVARPVPQRGAAAIAPAPSPAPADAVHPTVRALLVAALAVVLWEIGALGRQWWRLRGDGRNGQQSGRQDRQRDALPGGASDPPQASAT